MCARYKVYNIKPAESVVRFIYFIFKLLNLFFADFENIFVYIYIHVDCKYITVICAIKFFFILKALTLHYLLWNGELLVIELAKGTLRTPSEGSLHWLRPYSTYILHSSSLYYWFNNCYYMFEWMLTSAIQLQSPRHLYTKANNIYSHDYVICRVML